MSETILDLTRVNKQEGEVGIEIEVEGAGFVPFPTYWRMEQDGSLRGESAEYVLSKPVDREKVYQVLDYLDRKFVANSVRVKDSDRTSVHVHINVQQMTRTQVLNFILLYLVFEDTLIEQCGDTRKSNIYCLRASDAEYLLKQIKYVVKTGDWYTLHHDSIRYSAINLRALFKYGSLEFRAMRGTTNKDVISNWVNILLKLKDASFRFNHPRELVETLSAMGTEQFVSYVFQEMGGVITVVDDWRDRVQRGVWNIQDIAYSYREKKKEKLIVPQPLDLGIPLEQRPYTPDEDENFEDEDEDFEDEDL